MSKLELPVGGQLGYQPFNGGNGRAPFSAARRFGAMLRRRMMLTRSSIMLAELSTRISAGRELEPVR